MCIRDSYNSYLHPAKLDDEMEISIWISHWGTTSFTISFSFEKKGTKIILAKGYCRLVCVSIEDKQKVKIPELLRSCLLYTSPSPRDRTRSRMPSSA